MWSEHGQTTRFVAVAKHLHTAPAQSVLDYGCGDGRFSEFIPRTVSYFGYDWSEGMLERARKRSRGSYSSSMPDWRVDHIVCIGTFNLTDEWSKEQTWRTLRHLYNHWARRSVIVSLLRGEAEGCFTYTPEEAGAFAAIAKHSVIDCSYLENDMLLVLRRNEL